MNILITGAAGGIGSTLAYQLIQNGHKVVAYDNFNNGYIENLHEDRQQFCDIVFGDIRDTAKVLTTLNSYAIDVVIHLAALTSLPICESDPSECISVNVGGTASILDAVRMSRGQRVIVAGTSAIYENNDPGDAPFTEDLTVSPRLFYPLSKKLMEDTIQAYIINYGMDITTLRFFNVFGPRQDIHRLSPPLINYVVREIKKGRQLEFYSNGQQVRDYVHVDDVVRLIELCLDDPRAANQIFNVCTGTLTSVLDIISYAETAFDVKLDCVFKESSKFWSSYARLSAGARPLLDSVLDREVNKFALGSYEHTYKTIGWQPNTDIKSLMIDTMREIKL